MQLDRTDWQILAALQQEARLSFVALGRRVGLSPPAATERVRKLEEAGIIQGYGAAIAPERLGLSLRAFVQLTTSPGHYPAIVALLQERPETIEAHHIAGSYSFLIEVVARSTQQLEDLLGKLSYYGQTNTAIVLSTPIPTRAIALPPPTES